MARFNHTDARIIKLYNKQMENGTGPDFESIAKKMGHPNTDRVRKVFFPDNCEVCKGEKGGYRGNENVIDGVVTCDYCHAEQSEVRNE